MEQLLGQFYFKFTLVLSNILFKSITDCVYISSGSVHQGFPQETFTPYVEEVLEIFHGGDWTLNFKYFSPIITGNQDCRNILMMCEWCFYMLPLEKLLQIM